MLKYPLHRDAASPEEYQLVDGYAEGVQDVVHGYQAKVASLGQSTKTRHPGGRGGGKRGGKVRSLALPPATISGAQYPPLLGRVLPSLCSRAHAVFWQLHDQHMLWQTQPEGMLCPQLPGH